MLPRCFALLAAFVLLASGVRADVITPDSIPNPPSAVGSASWTPIPSVSDLVTTQYMGLGLNFTSSSPSLTVITRLKGVSVWAPAQVVAVPASGANGSPLPIYPVGVIDYSGKWTGGGFVLPGTLNPTTVSSATLEIVGNQQRVVDFLNSKGQWVGAAPSGIGPHGGQLYTLSSASRFSVFELPPPSLSGGSVPPWNPAWGVAEVSFTRTPEPGSLLLAGLGALGMAAGFARRRARPGS